MQNNAFSTLASSLVLYVLIDFWAIHDGIGDNPIINGAACHTMHHLYFMNYNYGQLTGITTLWDRLGGSHRKPNEELFRRETEMTKKEWEKQTKEMETILKTVEGGDDRSYCSAETIKKGFMILNS